MNRNLMIGTIAVLGFWMGILQKQINDLQSAQTQLVTLCEMLVKAQTDTTDNVRNLTESTTRLAKVVARVIGVEDADGKAE